MPPGQRTPPELEERAVALIREGKTRAQVSEATGIHFRTLTEIAKRNQVEWARTGSGSSGTPEAMNRARDYRSEYMRNRREQIADKLLDAAEKSADLAVNEADPRRRQALMQSADASMRAYANVTKGDLMMSDREQMQGGISMLEQVLVVASSVVNDNVSSTPIRPGLIQE